MLNDEETHCVISGNNCVYALIQFTFPLGFTFQKGIF